VDQYTKLAHSAFGRTVMPRVGLPRPPLLRRYEPGQVLLPGPAVVGGAPGGRLLSHVQDVLKRAGAEVHDASDAGLRPTEPHIERPAALVFDASGIARSEDLVALHDFFGPLVRGLRGNGRVVVLGTPPELAGDPRATAAQRALEGFTRALGKELGGRGTAVQLVLVAPGAEERIESTLRFLLSARSAFVSGQVVRIGFVPRPVGGREVPPVAGPDDVVDPDRPLEGRVVAVTGASHGIGEAIARTLTRDGATVVGIDVPALASDLEAVTRSIGGSSLLLDVTSPDAGPRIARHVRERHGGRLDGVVHNAGITRDRKLANMKADGWKSVVAVNLTAPERITASLLEEGVLGEGGRVVVISSIAGIAGNNGQTNYAASKAGLIGMVAALAPELAARGITINAVAPGFIETQMTAKVPIAIREAGRRLSSMLQGGQPVDVAETIAWYLQPASSGVSGNLVRVCGQALIGA
jgi:3-oxoacyl-[acyl-carrier protein] reductase